MSDHVIDLPVAGQRVEEAVPVLSMNGKLLLSLPILIVGFSVDYNEQIFSFLVAENSLHLTVEQPIFVVFLAVSESDVHLVELLLT